VLAGLSRVDLQRDESKEVSMMTVTRWNLSLRSVLAAPILIGILFTGCARVASEPPQPRGFGEALHDAGITTSVKLSLAFEPGVSAMEVHVNTNRGVVTLSGEVSTEAERQLAAKVAEDAANVKEVVNDLRVRG
jgi:BON domain-containing protein